MQQGKNVRMNLLCYSLFRDVYSSYLLCVLFLCRNGHVYEIKGAILSGLLQGTESKCNQSQLFQTYWCFLGPASHCWLCFKLVLRFCRDDYLFVWSDVTATDCLRLKRRGTGTYSTWYPRVRITYATSPLSDNPLKYIREQ